MFMSLGIGTGSAMESGDGTVQETANTKDSTEAGMAATNTTLIWVTVAEGTTSRTQSGQSRGSIWSKAT